MLELRQISKRFGAVLANDRVDLAVAPGTIHAVVGENGAGKSTAMLIAYGFHHPDSGEILVAGQPVRFATPQDAIRLGIAMVHQHFMLVDTMTVTENVVLGAEPGSPLALDLGGAAARVAALGRELGLAVDPHALVADLSVGQQQRVELVKALYRDARLLILDEPTAVLAPQEVAELFAVLRRLRAAGKTVVLVTHKLSEVLALADAVTVMRDGCAVASVETRATSAAELARWIVGREVLLRVEKTPARPGEVVLSVRELTLPAGAPAGSRRLDGISFEVRAGEVVGIAGVEGNGQTELVEALAGLLDAPGFMAVGGGGGGRGGEAGGRRTKPGTGLGGSIELDGVELAGTSVRQRRRRGMGHVPEDRQRRGLVLDFDLAENAVLGDDDRPPAVAAPGGIWLDRSAMRRHAEKLLAVHDVRPADPELPARALSGGNQQKLVLGREIALGPRLLLVAQPTRGVDIGAIERIHRELIALRDRGSAVLLVSAELEEVMALADRLLVLHRGRVAGELDPAVATPEQVGLLMTGGGGPAGPATGAAP